MATDLRMEPARVFVKLNKIHKRLAILQEEFDEKGWYLEALSLRSAVRNINSVLKDLSKRRRPADGE